MGLASFGFFTILVFVLLVIVLASYMQRIAGSALTDHFQAAEAIAEGHIPDKWVAQINRKLKRKGILRLLQRNRSGTELALHKLDGLTRFFGNRRLYESDEAQEQLLQQFADTRQHWQSLSWTELVAEYGSHQ